MPHQDGIKYHYSNDDAEPLSRCPYCSHELTAEGGATIVISVAGHVIEYASRLDQSGNLLDTGDGAVAKGFHSSTLCGACGEPLVEHEKTGTAM